MKKEPLVSIVIPVYNGENFLSEAIDSALAQTYKNIEIIVVNDGSKDNTEEIALSYGDKIRYFSKPNGGVSSALNLGIEKMQGEYFSWLSHDDLYAPQKIEKQILSLYPYIGKPVISVCDRILISEQGHYKGNARSLGLKGYITSQKIFTQLYLKQVALGGCSLLIPKEAFIKCGTFKPFKYVQDVDCWARMIVSQYDFIVIPDRLVSIRVHVGQVTNRFPQLYYNELPIYCNGIADYINEHSVNKEEQLKTLLKFSYQLRIKKSIEYIESYVSISFITKCGYKMKGYLMNLLRNIYRKVVKK